MIAQTYSHKYFHVTLHQEKKKAGDSAQDDATHLFKYGLDGPASLPASGEGHDAEGAHVVAPPHDGQVSTDTACWPDGQNVCIGFFCAELHIHGTFLLPPTGAGPPLQQEQGVSNFDS